MKKFKAFPQLVFLLSLFLTLVLINTKTVSASLTTSHYSNDAVFKNYSTYYVAEGRVSNEK